MYLINENSICIWCTYLKVYLFTCLSDHQSMLSTCLPVYISFCPCLPFQLSICLLVNLSIIFLSKITFGLSFYMPTCLPVINVSISTCNWIWWLFQTTKYIFTKYIFESIYIWCTCLTVNLFICSSDSLSICLSI